MRRSATAPPHRDIVSEHTAHLSFRLVAGAFAAIIWIGADSLHAQFDAKQKDKPSQLGGAADDEEAESVFGLPPGFDPPGDPHPSMSIHEELITPEEYQQFRKDAGNWALYMFDGEGTGSKGDLIKRGIEVYVKRLTLFDVPSELDALAYARDKFMRNIANAVPGQTTPKARQFREMVCDEVTKQVVPLLDNNFHIRLQAVYILSELTVQPADFRTGAPPIPYAGAAEPLLSVIEDPAQPMVLKIASTNGLIRILRFGELRAQERQRIAESMMAQLDDPTEFFWYQRLLVAALGWSDVVVDDAGLPTVVQKLSQVMVDERRPWQVRAQAAKSLGRAKLNSQIKVDVLAWGVASLVQQMIEASNEDPGAPYWGECFWNAYLAFKPDRDEEQRQAGLLNKLTSAGFGQYTQTVRGAYNQVVPIVQYHFDNPRLTFPGEVVDPLKQWLGENRPPDLKVHPNLDPISSLDPVSSTAEETGTELKTAG